MITTIIKRNGTTVPFDPTKIVIVMKKAFAAEQVPVDDSALEQMTGRVVVSLTTLCDGKTSCPTVEQVQDLVENTLMERGYFGVAKSYILYRFKQSEERKQEVVKEIEEQRLTIRRTDGSIEQFSREKMREYLAEFVTGYEKEIDLDEIVAQIEREVYDGIKTSEMAKLATLVLRARIEKDPAYSVVAARQLVRRVTDEVVGNQSTVAQGDRVTAYRNAFVRNVKFGVEAKKYDTSLLG